MSRLVAGWQVAAAEAGAWSALGELLPEEFRWRARGRAVGGETRLVPVIGGLTGWPAGFC